ncbi:MAG: hypothetical protein GY941_21805 [Planctomycetes bacterium]|nr:hypothetical protein [Planctomycetota bacterium]
MANNRPTVCKICGGEFGKDGRVYDKNYGCNVCKAAMSQYRRMTRVWQVDGKDVKKLPIRERIRREMRIKQLCVETGGAV